jgi:hypothetical protein
VAGLTVVREADHPVDPPRRLVLLGASNLVRGLHVLLGVARAAWGRDLEVLGAIGLGRSYGRRSMVLGRVLPGIVESGLWEELERRPRLPTRAIVTDVGNDILYNAPAADIVGWVATCVARLRAAGAEVVVSGLPLARVERLTGPGYAALRTLVFPRYRWLPRAEALARAREVDEGLRGLAAEAGATFFEPPAAWYGLDPIHLRLGTWGRAWSCLLAGHEAGLHGKGGALGALTALRLAAAPPARQWLFGRERKRAQPALTIPGGTTVSLY